MRYTTSAIGDQRYDFGYTLVGSRRVNNPRSFLRKYIHLITL